MKYFVIAGEPSGDLHASRLMGALSRLDGDAEFAFLGGDLMAAEAGHEPVIHYRRMAFMGFAEVLRNLRQIFRNLAEARRALADSKPDVVILVDYPSFNLKIARTARELGIPCCWYISPKLWAWKAWRVKAIRKLVGRMLCIFPFEPQWYVEHGYDRAIYVGNPTIEEIESALAAAPPKEEFLSSRRLRTNRPVLALMPGSRRGEIADNLPVMDAAARQFPQYTIVVAGAPGIPDVFYEGLTKFPVIKGATHSLLAHSHAALVTSGTATLEAAVAKVPQVVLYRSNGRRISYELMKSVLKVKYVSLPNLIADRPVVPELLLHNCTVEDVAAHLRMLTPDSSPQRAEMLAGYDEVARRLAPDGSRVPSVQAAEAVLSFIES